MNLDKNYYGGMYQAGEHGGKEMTAFLMESKLNFKHAPVYPSQFNGATERLIQELWKFARALLLESKLDLTGRSHFTF